MKGKDNNSPLVSIGIPVYNGENYLREAIESVVNQTYNNWELVISDNGSSDSTEDICNEYLKKDSRVRYSRFDENQGASRNYNKVFELSSGKYFKWLPHDDKISKDNLEKSVQVLESNEDIVLCGSAKQHIDSEGHEIDTYWCQGLNLDQSDTIQRYKAFLNYFAASFANADFIMGLIRSDVLKETNLIGKHAADFILLAELILRGKFHVIEEPLFFRRIHHGISTSIYNDQPELAKNMGRKIRIKHKSNAEIIKWYDPQGNVKSIPHLTWFNQLNRSIKKEKFDFIKKSELSLSLYMWIMNKFFISVRYKISKMLLVR